MEVYNWDEFYSRLFIIFNELPRPYGRGIAEDLIKINNVIRHFTQSVWQSELY